MVQVRFFERVKLERRINKLDGKQARGHALSADEQQQITDAKSDLQVLTDPCCHMLPVDIFHH